MNRLFLLAILVSLTLVAQDIIIEDFEGPDYGDWTVVGTAFGPKPASGTLPSQMPVSGFQGRQLVNSYYGMDGSMGKLTSPVFDIQRKYITYLIGGGGWKGETCINLLIETTPGKFELKRTDTGTNVVSGGSEELRPAFWDVSEFLGRKARIEIVDSRTGGWGHINIDHIVATDTKPKLPLYDIKLSFQADKPYLLLPVRNGFRQARINLNLEGKNLKSFTMAISDKPDWHATIDLAAYQGKNLELHIDRLPSETDQAALYKLSDKTEFQLDPAPYSEAERAQIHFTPFRGWNNDPNGLAFYNNEYHLFFQHNPYGTSWGNMHWGHAVSTDLVHWKELPIALEPDPMGAMFSGSAVVDHANTSGFGQNGIAPLVLVYTATGNGSTQCLASSVDGRTFTKYPGNPVLESQTPGNRDPKVIWHSQSKRWIMALYVGRSQNSHTVELWASKDFKNWDKLSVIQGGVEGSRTLFECPEFFEIALEGTSETRWVVFGANGQYIVGTFDGTKFTPETQPLRGFYGHGLYAGQTFNHAPKGRRILIYWLTAATPCHLGFSQAMSLPQELKLVSTADGPRLARAPIKEIESLRVKTTAIAEKTNSVKLPDEGFFECRIQAKLGQADSLSLNFRGTKLNYDAKTQILSKDNIKVPLALRDNGIDIHAFIDNNSIELFSEDGLVHATFIAFPKAGEVASEITASNHIDLRVTHYRLNSIWK